MGTFIADVSGTKFGSYMEECQAHPDVKKHYEVQAKLRSMWTDGEIIEHDPIIQLTKSNGKNKCRLLDKVVPKGEPMIAFKAGYGNRHFVSLVTVKKYGLWPEIKAEIDSIEAALDGIEVPGGVFNREKFLKTREKTREKLFEEYKEAEEASQAACNEIHKKHYGGSNDGSS